MEIKLNAAPKRGLRCGVFMKVLSYLREYKKECFLAPLLKFLEASFELIVPLIIAAIIDNGIAYSNKGYIIKMCCLLAAFAVFGLIIAVVAQYFSAKAATAYAGKVRLKLFKHIQTLSFSELDSIGTSTLITRITSDVNQLQNGVNLVLRLALRSPFVVFGAMIMAFTIDVKSALIFVATIPVLSIIVFIIMLICIPLYKKVQLRLDKLLGITKDNLSGVRVIRAFSKEKNEIADFCGANNSLAAMQKFVGRISSILNPATYIVINLAIVWLIHSGAIRVGAGLLTQGAVVALYNYMSQILVELIKLANLIINITKAVASAKRLEAVLQIQPSINFKSESPKEDANAPVVEFKDVSLKYAGSLETAIDNISFKVFKGQTIGIIGGTGSGKSSLVNMIPRFYEANSGCVLVNGVDVKEYPADVLRAKIGFVPQKAVLFKGTVRENLLMGNQGANEADLIDALKLSMAFDFVAAKEGGIDAAVAQEGKNFSGGQRQRLTIARALVRRPEIIILDDSASALDFATEAALRKSINSLEYNPTVFIVSQRCSSIAHADKIIVLDDGLICGIGNHEELINKCEVYKEIYNSQFNKEGK